MGSLLGIGPEKVGGSAARGERRRLRDGGRQPAADDTRRSDSPSLRRFNSSSDNSNGGYQEVAQGARRSVFTQSWVRPHLP